MSNCASFVRLFVGVVLTATGVCASCPIEVSPPRVVVKFGDPVSVNCSTSETLFEGIGWEATKGGRSLEVVNHLTWSVRNLTDWTISPSCYITPSSNGTFMQCSKKPDVVLYTFPENVTIRSNTRGGMTESEGHSFTCHIANIAPVQNLAFTWYKGGAVNHRQTFNSPRKTPVNQSSVYRITPTRQDNGVTVRCEAHMDLGPEGPKLHLSSEESILTVYYGPDILTDFIDVPEGGKLEDYYPVLGNPLPSLKWRKGGQLTDPSLPLSWDDAGPYDIEAEGLSVIQKTVNVNVIYGPLLTCPNNYTVVENTPHSLTCNATGYPTPVTKWYKDGEEVELLENLTRSDSGQYVIIASNNFTTVNVTVELTVEYPPSLIFELEDAEVDIGFDAWLKCSSTAHPRPNYSWNYTWNNNVRTKDEDGVSRLLIHNATANNAGLYTCRTFNERGGVSKTVRLTVKDPRNVDNATPREAGRCQNVTFYKIPDSIFIRTVHNLSSVVEGTELQLQCDIICVAPAQNLSIRWYHGNDTFEPLVKGSMQVTGCQSENSTDCDISIVRSPVNVSSTISITVNRRHSRAEFRCEALMDLGSKGQQPPPNITSSPLIISVNYTPILNSKKLPNTVPVFRGYPEELVCEAEGHPPPKIQWFYSADKLLHVSNNTLTVFEAGFYNCTATNEVGSVFHVVEVILKEDYLPLLAGFVAVTVVAISVIFLFIYSIYYKNTKMRRYSLKNPKLSNHTGNVAHNGWDLQFPMTKLS